MAARRRIDLNGTWSYVVDQYMARKDDRFARDVKLERCIRENPHDHSVEPDRRIDVPACWNMALRELHYFEGALWYYLRFPRPALRGGQRALLCFEGANYRTRAWLNEQPLGEHLGGFTPFQFEITRHLRPGSNFLAVEVDARRLAERVPTTVTDWFSYGGLCRDVHIEIRPARHVTDLYCTMDRRGRIVGSVSTSGPGEVTLAIPELGVTKKLTTKGRSPTARYTIAADPVRWSPANPKLYEVTAAFGGDVVRDEVGFRTIETADGRFLLNGEPIWLKGISVHEDHVSRGRSLTDADRMDVFRHARALGLNFLRLAHYPHSRRMAQMADRLGFLLWEEVPVYWRILWQNPETYADAANQLAELIRRDRSRASVILWSVANETPPDAPGRTAFLANLAKLARKLDPTRLVTAAQFAERVGGKIVITDPLSAHMDVLGVNQYGGWYDRDIANAGRFAAFANVRYPDKPVVISEFGAGARAGVHGAFKFTEQFQAEVYRRQLAAMSRSASIQGMTPWILLDFRSPMRMNRFQDGFNRKGLVDADRRTRKLAFQVYADFRPPTK
jgi:beta-glucuronidase